MKSNFKYRVTVGLALGVIISGLMSVDAFAQSAGGCFSGPAKMSDADISAFTSSPGNLLSNNPTGGLPLTSQVRSLVGSSATALDSLMGLVSQANAAQKAAFGGGLARAAKSCQAVSPDYAQLIQQKVAGANDKDLTAAFLAAMSGTDLQTAALGGGAGTGGGGAAGIGGNGAGGGSSGGGAGGDTSTSSGTDNFSVGSGGSFSRTVNQTFETFVVSPT